MQTRRARMVAASGLLLGALGAAATPAAAADCILSAPPYVNVGTNLTIQGTGFPASTDVDVALAVAGGGADEFTITSDASGGLQISLTPEPIDIGVTTMTATAGPACSARVTYTVLAAGATPPPATPAPTDQAGTGDAGDDGAAPGAPSTDAAGTATTGLGLGGWALALALVTIGGMSLLLTREPRRR